VNSVVWSAFFSLSTVPPLSISLFTFLCLTSTGQHSLRSTRVGERVPYRCRPVFAWFAALLAAVPLT